MKEDEEQVLIGKTISYIGEGYDPMEDVSSYFVGFTDGTFLVLRAKGDIDSSLTTLTPPSASPADPPPPESPTP